MFEPEIIGLIGIGALFALLALRVPVALAMAITGIGGNYVLSLIVPYYRFGPYLKQFKTLLWGTVANYELSVVPLFILMGFLATKAHLSRDLFQGFNALVGRFRGGVAMAAIGSCAGFGAVCGSSLATASTMGKVALPELARMNYAPRLATGTLAAGGTLGILIPPSIALVLYAIIVEASIIDMFQAAIIPGLIAVMFFTATIAFLVRRNPAIAPLGLPLSKTQRRAALLRLFPVLGVFGAIILGLGFGLFAPTPAASIGVFVILSYGLFVRYRNPNEGLSFVGLKSALLETAVTSGMIYFILFGAEIFKGFMVRAGLPSALASWASTTGIDPWLVLALMLIALIVLGCFMDSLAMILVVIPFFWPVLVDLNGSDTISAANAAYGLGAEDLKIWFGVVALIVVELGLITPPVGLNVFIISSLSPGTPMGEIFKGVLPFFTVELLRIALLMAIPSLCLFLPHLLAN